MRSQISRRAIIASLAMGTVSATGRAAVHGQVSPEVVSLSPALEIRDYRLFPTSDVMRFIVEVHNTGDTIVDAPTVGVKVPGLIDAEGYGVAAPAFPVVYPHSSVALFGVAPTGITDDSQWGNPEWLLCDELQRTKAIEAENTKVSVQYEVEVISDVNMAINFEIENLEDQDSPPFYLGGSVFDESKRICGVISPWYFRPLLPRQSYENRLNVARGMGHYGTPFILVDNVYGLDVEVHAYPPSGLQNYSCPPVMPWN